MVAPEEPGRTTPATGGFEPLTVWGEGVIGCGRCTVGFKGAALGFGGLAIVGFGGAGRTADGLGAVLRGAATLVGAGLEGATLRGATRGAAILGGGAVLTAPPNLLALGTRAGSTLSSKSAEPLAVTLDS